MKNFYCRFRTLAALTAGLATAQGALAATTATWSGGGATKTWATPANWTGSQPGPTADVKFFDAGADPSVATVNNIVDTTTTVLSLQYGNTNQSHTTLINPGVTLTNLGNLVGGTETAIIPSPAVTATITGAGGRLVVNNPSASVLVRQNGGASGVLTTLDMSGLDTFIASVSSIQIATLISGGNRPQGSLLLAKTNTITASGGTPAINIGLSGSNNGNGTSKLALGQTNAIFANSIAVGRQKQTGCSIVFNTAAFTSPFAYFRAANGAGRISTWIIGDGESNGGTTSCRGTCDFTGGTVDAQVDTMIVGRASSNTSGSGTSQGTLTFESGTFDINTLQVGLQTANTGKAGDGTVNVNGTATLLVNSLLQLGQATGGAGTAATIGRLNIAGGTVHAAAIASSGTNGNCSPITLSSGGTLVLDTTAGAPLNPISTLSLSDSTLRFPTLALDATNIFVTTLTASGSGNLIDVGLLPSITRYPVTITLIKYDPNSSAIYSAFSLTNVSAAYSASIVNDTTASAINLVISSGPIPKALTWKGASSGNWDTSTPNWLASGSAANYNQGDFTTFDDTASGATTVNLPATLTPGSITVNNAVKSYTFTGPGKLSGATGLTKQGSGTLILDNSGTNDFFGDITLSAGTIQVGNADSNGSLGAGDIANNGTLAFNRSDAVNLGNVLSGSGSLLQNGSGTLTVSAANPGYTGAVTVAQGTLKLGNYAAVGSSTNSPGLTIASGATLDLNGFGPTNIAVTVSGSGINGNGAIINSGAAVYPALTRVTLSGDTTLGGPGVATLSGGAAGRWDIRLSGSGSTDPSLCSLSTGGHAYNLTKVGSNYIAICNATIDPALADIDIQQGSLSFQYNDTSLGDPNRTLTVRAGASLVLYNLTNQLNKQFVLYGNGLATNLYNSAGANTVIGPMTLNGANICGVDGTSLTLNGNIDGTGSLLKTGNNPLILNGNNTYSGSTTVTSGLIALNGNNSGLLTNTPNSTITGTGIQAGAVFVGGTLNPGAVGAPGTFTTGPLTFVSGGTLVLDLTSTTTVGGGVNDLLQVNGDLSANNTVISLNLLQGYLPAGTYRLINYTGNLLGSFNPTVTLVGGGATRATMQLDTHVAGQVNLVVAGNPASLKWASTSDSNWDVATTANWLNLGSGLSSTFYQGDSALLDDSVPGVQTSLVLNTNIAPVPLTINSTANYSITGSGKITDGTSIIKQGAGTLLLGTGNDFTGPVLVQGGILQVTNNASLGATNGGTVISSGATLDVCGVATNNALNLGLEPITVSGPGFSSNGAIINSGAYQQQNAVRLVTLTGDTSFGGPGDWHASNNPGRWDIRGTGATLSTGGNAYNLTKTGANQVSLVGAVVDPNLADIDIQQGLLGLETTTTSMGNPANTLTVRAGATLSFYNTTNLWNKVLVLYGDGANTNVYNWSGSNTFIGPITLNNDCVVAVNGTALAFTGTLGGSGGLVKSLGNPLYLYGANTYTGNTQIKGGTLCLGEGASIANSSTISVASGAALDVSRRADGTFTLGNAQTLSGSGTVRGSLSAGAGSTLIVGAASGGTLTVTNNLTLNSSSNLFTLFPGGTGDTLLAVSNNLTLMGVTHLYVTVGGLLSQYETHTIISYGGTLNGSASNFQVHAPPGYAFSVVTSSPNVIQLQVTAVPADVTWVGDKSGTWDTTTFNWSGLASDYTLVSTNFSNGQVAHFDDSSSRTLVSLGGTLSPSSVVFQNVGAANGGKDYTLTGTGKLTGGATLKLQNYGRVVLDNSGGDDYSGGTTVSYGVVQVGNNDTFGGIGSGPVTIENGGALVFNRTDNLLISNSLSGYSGSFTNLGTGMLTLAGSNGFSGQITATRGILRVDNNSALGDSISGTTILPGATLDVGGPTIGENRLNLANEPISVAGTGVGGQGAIVNSSTNRQYNALRNVTLTGDTAIGGPGGWTTLAQPGRWDIRYTPTSGTGGSLNTGYQPYKLTKVGPNQVSLVGVSVDPALGDIDVQQGLLGFEGGTTGMGDSNYKLTVHAGAAVSFYNTTVQWNKIFQLYGDGTNATIFNWAGNNTMVGPVTLNGGCVFGGQSGVLTNNGTIDGPGSLIKSGTNALVLNGANSYSGNTVVNEGRLSFGASSSLPSSPVFDLAGSSAILDLSTLGGSLTLNSGQSLRGNGSLWASLTANAGSTVSPGEASTGTLTITNDVALYGTTVMKLDNSTAGKSDQISTPRTLTVNGTLTITNVGPALVAGDNFKLFSASALSGSALPNVALPPLGPGLAWSNSLPVNGQIAVYATVSTVPTNLACQVSGKQLTLSWPADHIGWRLVTNSVDVANSNYWYTYPGSTTMNQIIINVDPNRPKVFYRLVYP